MAQKKMQKATHNDDNIISKETTKPETVAQPPLVSADVVVTTSDSAPAKPETIQRPRLAIPGTSAPPPTLRFTEAPPLVVPVPTAGGGSGGAAVAPTPRSIQTPRTPRKEKVKIVYLFRYAYN